MVPDTAERLLLVSEVMVATALGEEVILELEGMVVTVTVAIAQKAIQGKAEKVLEEAK